MAGVDEVGRGPLAGPVVAAAVILDDRRVIRGLNDSKLLTAPTRERLSTRSAPRRCASASARRASRRSTASTSCRPRCWRCAARSTACASCRRCLVDGNQLPGADGVPRRSSRATRRCRRSRPPRSSPRCIATGCATSCTKSTRSTASRRTRATRRRSTSPRCAVTAPAPPPAQLRAGARGALRPCAEDPSDQLARQPAARAGPPPVRQPDAYRKHAEVWLEGEHLARAFVERHGGTGTRAVVSEAAWDEPGLRALATHADSVAIVPGGADGRPEHARQRGADRLRRRLAGSGRGAVRCADRRARSPAGRRQRRHDPAQRGGVRLRPGDRAQGHRRAVVAQGAARGDGRALRIEPRRTGAGRWSRRARGAAAGDQLARRHPLPSATCRGPAPGWSATKGRASPPS